MYLIGHVGLALGLNFLHEQKYGKRGDRDKLLIGFGAMLPDFIDKPIGGLLFGKGRWFGHSIIFLTLVFLSLFYSRKDLRHTLSVVYLGTLLHLIGDMSSLERSVILWPLQGSVPTGLPEDFLLYLTTPFVMTTEVLGFLVITTIGIYERWSRVNWLIFCVTILLYLGLFVIMYSVFVGF